MLFKPEWLFLPEYIEAEIRECQMRVERGLYDTGLIVDANNLMYRLAFAASKDLYDAADLLAMFCERVRSTAKDIGAEIVVCGIDCGVSLRRSMLGAKKKPDKTPEQQAVIDMARKALKRMREGMCQNWLNPLFMDGYEADDICAAVAVSNLCVHTVLYSTDSDLYQVTNGSGITQLSPDTKRFLVSEVPRNLVAGVKALTGDTSDNVEGIKGIGPKTAMELLTGRKTREFSPEEVLRIRNNQMLTALPFPGAHRCLEIMTVIPFVENEEQASGSETEDDSYLPF